MEVNIKPVMESPLSTNAHVNQGSRKTDCKNLVVGGGGTLIYSYIGVLDTMFANEDLHNIENCIGTSAGSIIATIISCGGTLEYLKNKVTEFDIKKIADHSTWKIVELYHIINHFGYNRGDVALQWFGNVLEELTGNKDITFAEHYTQFKRNLIITGCNISRNTFRYFNRLSNPDMKIAHAIRISMSIPIFFRPYEYNGDLYLDGGITLNYPIAFVLSDMFKVLNDYRDDIIGSNYNGEKVDYNKAESNMYEHIFDIKSTDTESKNFVLKHTVGIKTFNKRTLNYIKPGSRSDANTNFDIYSFCCAIMSMATDATLREHIDEEMWIRTIKIDSTNFNSIDFNMTTDTIDAMIKLGNESAEKFKLSTQ